MVALVIMQCERNSDRCKKKRSMRPLLHFISPLGDALCPFGLARFLARRKVQEAKYACELSNELLYQL